MTDERYKELLNYFGLPTTNSLLACLQHIDSEATATEREACAGTAWNAGMIAHTNAAGMPCDAREVGSACARAIRART